MPRRTKACATCRQKRIKCDATMPHCQMCVKFKRQCPGPTDAPLMFIDTSSYPSGKKPRKRPSPPSSRKPSPPRPVVKPEPEHEHEDMQLASTTEAGGSRGNLPPELAYVTLVQISGRYVLSEALFASLARFFCAEGRYAPGAPKGPPTWLHALPRLATQSPTSSSAATKLTTGSSGKEALSLAIRATTAAFGGIEERNTGLLEYAAGLYGEALRAQGRVVARNAGGSGKKPVGMDMVATSVMLSMFEAVVATTGRAYAEHIIGTAKMLDVAMTQSLKLGGPPPPPSGKGGGAGCGDGSAPKTGPGPLLTHIFFHTRIQLAFVLLTSVEAKVRTDPVMERVLVNACGWPYVKMPLNQQIIRPLALLIMLTFPSAQTTSASASSRLATYTSARDEVSTLWTKYQYENKGQTLWWFNEKTGRTDFRDPFSAIQYGYFSACWLLLQRLEPPPPAANNSPPPSPTSMCSSTCFLDSVAPTQPHSRSLPLRPSASPPPQFLTNSSTPPSTRHSAMPSPPSDPTPIATDPDHFALILSVASFLKIRNVGFSYLRLHLPLFLVAMYAPSVEQRLAARKVFEEWEGGALRGIGVLGLERLSAGGG
jgi:hypothetical protein